MHNKIPKISLPLSLFLAGFLLRLSLISKGPYHLDCLSLLNASENFLKTGTISYLHTHGYPLLSFIGPGFVWAGKFFGFPDNAFSINMISVLFSSLCLLPFYAITKRFAGQAAAVFATVLFCVSPIFLGNSVYGNSHGLSLFFMLMGTLLLLFYKEKPTATSLVGAGICFGLFASGRVQDAAVMVPPIVLLYALYPSINKGKNTTFLGHAGRIAFILAVSAGVGTLFYLDVLSKRFCAQNSGAVDYAFKSGLGNHFVGFFSLSYLYLCWKYLLLNYSWLGTALLLTSAAILIKKDARKAIILLGWMLFPIFVFGSMNDVTPRFLITSLPPAYILLGFIFSEFYKHKAFFKLSCGIIFLILTYMNLFQIYPLVKARHDHAYLPEFAGWLKQRVDKNAVLLTADDGPFYQYYTNTHTERPPIPSRFGQPTDRDAFKQSINNHLLNGTPVYITMSGLYCLDHGADFPAFLANNFKIKIEGWRISEDWHRGVIYENRLRNIIYSIHLPDKK